MSIAHSIYRNHESSLYGNELDTLFAVKIFEEMQMACLGAKKKIFYRTQYMYHGSLQTNDTTRSDFRENGEVECMVSFWLALWPCYAHYMCFSCFIIYHYKDVVSLHVEI